MTTTSNGKSWGHNVGNLGQWTTYGLAAKRAIEAEQRRPDVVGEDPWKPVKYTATVFVFHNLYVWAWIVLTCYMLAIIAYLPIGIATGAPAVQSVIAWLLLGLPALIFTRLCQKAMGEAKHVYEGLRPDRPMRRFIPKGAIAMFFLPQFTIVPVSVVMDILGRK